MERSEAVANHVWITPSIEIEIIIYILHEYQFLFYGFEKHTGPDEWCKLYYFSLYFMVYIFFKITNDIL